MKSTILAPPLKTICTVKSWHKNLGEAIYAGDILVNLVAGSEKEEIPLLATQFGVLVKKCILPGEAIEYGEPVAILSVSPNLFADIKTPTTAPYIAQGPETIHTPQRFARHHTYALLNIPTVVTQIAFDPAEILRLATKTEGNILPFVIAAVAAQLKLFPMLNAQWLSEKEVRYKENVHIALEKGVLSFADTKSVAQIAREVREPNASFPPTFTLTDLSQSRIGYQTPVFHLPQVAHLILLRDQLILAHDARVITERQAIDFLEAVVLHLENAAFLFV